MVQQLRQEEPLYSSVVAIDSITGYEDEEPRAFGVSADEAKQKVEQLLAEGYVCNGDQVFQLIQQARTEPLPAWCAAAYGRG
ncbi:MAG TPA: hypothetical protein V6D03_16100 [Candidatus Caenarcaniphilales bacterium]